MPFFDQVLKQQVQYQINVDNSAGGKTAITILKINRRDRLAAAEQLSVAPGARTTLTDTAAGNIDRVIMQVHPNPGGVCSVEIKSNANWLFANHAVQKIDSREVRPSGLVPQSGRIVGLGEKTSFGRRPMKHSRVQRKVANMPTTDHDD